LINSSFIKEIIPATIGVDAEVPLITLSLPPAIISIASSYAEMSGTNRYSISILDGLLPLVFIYYDTASF
jgi:hypothetical protein